MDGGASHRALPRIITLSTGTGATPLSHPTPHWLSVAPTCLIILPDLICSEGDRQRVGVQSNPVVTAPRARNRPPLRLTARLRMAPCIYPIRSNPVTPSLMEQWRAPPCGNGEWASCCDGKILVLVYQLHPGRSRFQFQECHQTSILNFDIDGKMRPVRSALLTESTSTV